MSGCHCVSRVPALRSRGFSLIELAVTLAIFGIIAAIAAPAMSDYRYRAKTTAALDELANAISTAKSQAASRFQTLTFSFTQDTAQASQPIVGWSLKFGTTDQLVGTIDSSAVTVAPKDGNGSTILSYQITPSGMVQTVVTAPATPAPVDICIQFSSPQLASTEQRSLRVNRIGRLAVKQTGGCS